MTTIIGIQAKDSSFLEPYVLLFADSKGSDGSTNNTKLYSPNDANFAIACAGKILNQYFSKHDKDAQKIISEGGFLKKSELEHILSNMNSQMNSEIGTKNDYLVAIQEKIPQLCYVHNTDLKKAGRFMAEGSGREFTNSLNELKKYIIDDGLIISKRDAMDIGIESLKEASKYDKGTGGFASVGIITPTFKNILQNYASLHNT